MMQLMLVELSFCSMECPEYQKQWQTFPTNVILTAKKSVLERAPTTVTHVSTYAMLILWNALINVHRATMNVVATAMIQVYLPKSAHLLSRTRRTQPTLIELLHLNLSRLDVLMQDSQSAVPVEAVLLIHQVPPVASVLLSAINLETAVKTCLTLVAWRITVAV